MDNEKDLTVKEAIPAYNKRYTYSDYITWDDDQRWELLDGIPYLMSSPSTRHQAISSEIHGQLWHFLKGKPCDVFSAPFDVRLNADGADDTVVQPDIVVICNNSIITKNGCSGAPDLVIEILSPSTSQRDKLVKYRKYQQAGVREYWIIDPESNILQAGVLNNGSYITSVYGAEDKAPVYVLDNFEIDLAEVFAE